jgi:hypothetical protein
MWIALATESALVTMEMTPMRSMTPVTVALTTPLASTL